MPRACCTGGQKSCLLKARKTGLPLADRERIYATARKAANQLTKGENVAKMHLNVEDTPIGMPRQLGFARGRCHVSITVQLVLHDKVDLPAD